jgi:hypothetical protein
MLCIAKSQKHGIGVFAAQHIPEGTELTRYGDREMVPGQFDAYGMDFPDGVSRTGDPSTRDIARCGHLVNDYDSLVMEPGVTYKDAKRRLAKYETLSTKTNVIFGDKSGLMISRRDIECGEELTYWYGPLYWLSLIGTESEYPLVRFLAWILMREYRTSKQDNTGLNIKVLCDDELATRFISGCLKVRVNGWPGWRVLECEKSTPSEKVKCMYEHILHGGA